MTISSSKFKTILTITLALMFITTSMIVLSAEDDVSVDGAVGENIKSNIAEEGQTEILCTFKILTEPTTSSDKEVNGTVQVGDETDIAIDPSSKGAIVIPATVKDSDGKTYDVTSIMDYAFQKCVNLTSVIIPGSVTSIGNGAFYQCTALASVTIENSVKSIGKAAFYQCTSLTSVTIEEGVESIGENVFDSCTALTSITIPGSVTHIGPQAFSKCTSLTSITIPGSIESIGEGAFSLCENLSTVEISNSGNTSSYLFDDSILGDWKFDETTYLSTIIIGSNAIIEIDKNFVTIQNPF